MVQLDFLTEIQVHALTGVFDGNYNIWASKVYDFLNFC